MKFSVVCSAGSTVAIRVDSRQNYTSSRTSGRWGDFAASTGYQREQLLWEQITENLWKQQPALTRVPWIQAVSWDLRSWWHGDVFTHVTYWKFLNDAASFPKYSLRDRWQSHRMSFNFPTLCDKLPQTLQVLKLHLFNSLRLCRSEVLHGMAG